MPLTIDEMIAGLRLACGRARAPVSVTPELATYGKLLGGRSPIGAGDGRADLLDVVTRLAGAHGIYAAGRLPEIRRRWRQVLRRSATSRRARR